MLRILNLGHCDLFDICDLEFTVYPVQVLPRYFDRDMKAPFIAIDQFPPDFIEEHDGFADSGSS